MIATFEDEPYRAPFSGNVIELCPVGALTSTQYRFEARPVGDPERPDRLRPLPGRLQHHARRRARARSSGSSRGTTRRSTRAGSATRAASATRTSTPRDRVKDPLRKVGKRRFEELSWDDALDEAESLLRQRPGAARAVGLRDGRAGGGAVAARPAGARLRRRRPARAGLARDRRLPRAALVDPRRRPRRRRSATTRSRSALPSSRSGSRRRAGTARRSSPSARRARTRPRRATAAEAVRGAGRAGHAARC